jgi:anti-sigma B factor antagonist
MHPSVDKIGDVAVITVNLEELDAGNADDFRGDLAPILEENHKLVLDLGKVRFIDSRGCGAILSCLKNASAAGGDLKLCQVQRPVRSVFELIRLHRICEIVNTREEAVRAFRAPSEAGR